MTLAMGLNSGSSFDGIDVVLCEIDLAEDGLPARPVFKAGKSFDWPEAVAVQILKAFEGDISIFELCRLNYLAGAVYAEAARAMMQELDLAPGALEVIGFDGQTIYQEPPARDLLNDYAGCDDLVRRWSSGAYPCGLQIGEPAIIAVACDTPTVTHFRTVDHALGGNGAPLMQYLDFVAFRDIGPVLTLNIGGIANVQVAHADRARMMAFDTGPGNVMIDHAMKALFGRPYDKDGEVAATAEADRAMLGRLKAHPYFARPVPRSAWRLDFGSAFADAALADAAGLSPAQIIATLTEFTAWGIAKSITDYVPDLAGFHEVIASGGGVRNSQLLRRLNQHLPGGLQVVLSDKYGIPAQYKEAVKFATLAHATVNGLANNIPAASGASGFAILGKLVQPPRLARI